MHKFLPLLFLLIVMFIYASHINNQHLLDDPRALAQFVDGSEQYSVNPALVSSTGPLGRPVSMFAFYVESTLFGGTYAVFKGANLVLHLLCLVLIYRFTRKVLALVAISEPDVDVTVLSVWIALFWFSSSIHVPTVLYAVQQMAILACLFMLLAMLAYIAGRERVDAQPMQSRLLMYVLAPVFVGLAVFSKENGVLAIVLIALIELCFFRFKSASGVVKDLVFLYASGLVAVLLLLLINFDTFLAWLSYTDREFTAYERLLTETRILWDYVLSIFVHIPSDFGYFHDDIAISKSMWMQLSTSLSVLSWVGVVVISLTLVIKRKQLWFAFGCLFFLLNHLLESTAFGLELYFEHRNYLASLGVVMVVCIGLWSALKRSVGSTYVHVFFWGCLLAQLIFLSSKSGAWSDYETGLLISAQNHPESPRTLVELSSSFAAQKELDIANQVLADLVSAKPDYQSPATFHRVLNHCLMQVSIEDANYSGLQSAVISGNHRYLTHMLEALSREIEKEHCHFQNKEGFSNAVSDWGLRLESKNTLVAEKITELLLALEAHHLAVEILYKYNREGVYLTPSSHLLMLELLLSQDRCMDARVSLKGIQPERLSDKERAIYSEVKEYVSQNCRE